MPNSRLSRRHPDNERIKREYYRFLESAKGRATVSVDNAAGAIDRFETFTNYRSFKCFDTDDAVAFKNVLSAEKNKRTGTELSKTTQRTILLAVKAFFQWLSEQPGYRMRMKYSDAEYFNMSDKDKRIANTPREKAVPSPEQIKALLEAMPFLTAVEKRDRALVAFTYLTAARVSALASAKLKHVNLITHRFYQDAREVKTKFSKTITTWFFPVDPIAESIVVEWICFLRDQLKYSDDDPLFPSTQMAGGARQQFVLVGLSRRHWADTSSIRNIFKRAFSLIGHPYYNPHLFRTVLARLGEQVCQTPEEFKAWSQNLGHEDVMTTFRSYGRVSPDRCQVLMRALAERPEAPEIDLELMFNHLRSIVGGKRRG